MQCSYALIVFKVVSLSQCSLPKLFVSIFYYAVNSLIKMFYANFLFKLLLCRNSPIIERLSNSYNYPFRDLVIQGHLVLRSMVKRFQIQKEDILSPFSFVLLRPVILRW